ncbi:MAG: 3-methyladenine DNA glycosylase [Gammaproteobacteria bacterium]|nr:MAG: 3-methyladenine DNA glycosylase [Gammaproteobacteria bacterium]
MPDTVRERIIHTDDCVREGAEWLVRTEPTFGKVMRHCGPLPLRRKPDGFTELLSAIMSQQLSVASADAIWKRLADAGMVTPQRIRGTSEAALRALGLSRQKARYAKSLAEADIDFDALRNASTDDVVTELTAVTGIGVWTAEIYAMFSLGRADVFAPGDLALQEGARLLFALPERPQEKALREMAKAWSPWRSVAARALWAWYAWEKSRQGVR